MGVSPDRSSVEDIHHAPFLPTPLPLLPSLAILDIRNPNELPPLAVAGLQCHPVDSIVLAYRLSFCPASWHDSNNRRL